MAEKRTSLLGLVLASALLWGSSRLTWVAVSTSDDLRGRRATDLAGSAWSTELVPLALAVLAAVAAVLAVRGLALRAVALSVGVVGVLAALAPARLLLTGADPDRAAALLDPPVPAGQVSTSTSALGPVLALLGAVLTVVATAPALRAPRRAAGLSDRYQTPAARREQATSRSVQMADVLDPDLAERRLWDALDAGVDPTAEERDDPGDDPRRDTRHPAATLAQDQARDRGEGESSRS